MDNRPGRIAAALLLAGAILVFLPFLANPFRTGKLACAFLLALLLCAEALRGDEGQAGGFRPTATAAAAGLFILWQAAIIPVCVNPFDGLLRVATWVLGAALFAGARAAVRRPGGAALLARTIVAAGIAASVYGLCQAAGLDFMRWSFERSPISFFGRRNFAAEFAAAALPFAAALAAADRRRPWKAAGAACAALMAVHLLLTWTRASWIGAAAAGLLAAALLRCPRLRPALAGLLLAAVLTVGPAAAARAFSPGFEGRSFESRVRIWRVAAAMIRARPLLGVGPGNFELAYPAYAAGVEDALLSAEERVGSAHNDYLETAAETGLPGFLLFAVLLAAVGRSGVRAVRGRAGRERILPAAFCCSAAAVAVNALAAFPFKNPPVFTLFWLSAGALDALAAGEPLRRIPAVPRRAAGPALLLFAAGGSVLLLCGLVSGFRYGRALRLERRRPAAAFAEVRAGAAWNPWNYWNLLAGGRIALRAGRTAEAFDLLLRAGRLHPHLDSVRINLGVVYARAGRPDDAAREFEAAIRLNGKKPEARYNLARVRMDQGRTAEAVALLEGAVALRADYPEAWLVLGEALRRQGLPGRAADAFKRAAALDARAGDAPARGAPEAPVPAR